MQTPSIWCNSEVSIQEVSRTVINNSLVNITEITRRCPFPVRGYFWRLSVFTHLLISRFLKQIDPLLLSSSVQPVSSPA